MTQNKAIGMELLTMHVFLYNDNLAYISKKNHLQPWDPQYRTGRHKRHVNNECCDILQPNDINTVDQLLTVNRLDTDATRRHRNGWMILKLTYI